MAQTHRHVVRFTLEALTPLSVTTGFGSTLFDTELVRDANGLPTIPGTALAGVLSGLYRRHYPESADWRDLFGDEEENAGKEHAEKGQASRLEISFGCIHDQKDRAVEGLLIGHDRTAKLAEDKLLALAAKPAPLKRDHLAIGHRGTAKEKQKFDRASLPPGYRFSFEIAMWGEANEGGKLAHVARLIMAEDFRLGGATRRGLGKLGFAEDGKGAKRVYSAMFDLTNRSGRSAFACYRRCAIDEVPTDLGFQLLQIDAGKSAVQPTSFELKLNAVDFWRFGQGTRQLTAKPAGKDNAKDADSLPLTEAYVSYTNGQGQLLQGERTRIAIPASAVKGALLHRAEFHLNCVRLNSSENRFAGAEKCTETEFKTRCETRGMDAITGAAKSRPDKSTTQGMAGLLLIDDAYLEVPPETLLVPHNSIDRFSGGVRDGRLFIEEVLYGGSIVVRMTALPPRCSAHGITKEHRQALDLALADLCEGRLALGADGHGYFKWAGEGKRPSLLQAFGSAA